MKTIKLMSILKEMDEKDLKNLCAILHIPEKSSVNSIQDKIKWLYHSEIGAKVETGVRNVKRKIFSKIFTSKDYNKIKTKDIREVSTYNQLVIEACKNVKAYVKDASLEESELFLSQAIIIKALYKMKPRQRLEFFQKNVEIPKEYVPKNSKFVGPLTTFALLGLAQTSGFGIYLASTTALGFLTHAIGVTLPFAFYTGLTSTIAVLIGPVGWFSAGSFFLYKFLQPQWKKLLPAILYIISFRNKKYNTK